VPAAELCQLCSVFLLNLRTNLKSGLMPNTKGTILNFQRTTVLANSVLSFKILSRLIECQFLAQNLANFIDEIDDLLYFGVLFRLELCFI